jgi:hypothetical protein
MIKIKKLIPSGIAVLAAFLVSVFLREDTVGILASFVVALFALALALARCLRPQRPRWQILASTLIPAVVFAGITCSNLPLRLVFRLHRAEFDRVVSQIEMGALPATPFWIGPFKIKMVGRRGDSGTPYVATNEEKSEIDGFVKHPKGNGFNLWSCVTLDDKWAYIAED